VVLDAGIQTRGMALQAKIQSLTDEARSRVTALYIFTLFIGGSLGSFFGSALYQSFGYTAIGIYGLSLITVAAVIHFFAQKPVQDQEVV
jgi:predicted MFS family arabinose efflux permease